MLCTRYPTIAVNQSGIFLLLSLFYVVMPRRPVLRCMLHTKLPIAIATAITSLMVLSLASPESPDTVNEPPLSY